MKVHLTLKSSNAKTGPIPVSVTEKSSCPTRCPLKNAGCYAELGPLGMHWSKVPERGMEWDEFCSKISNLPPDQLWRHNAAGDLPGDGSKLRKVPLTQLMRANEGKKGFTYTHYSPKSRHNADLINLANGRGFTINLSAESLEQADEYMDLNIGPVVVVLPSGTKANLLTPKDRKVVVCPAVLRDDTTCATCGLCQHAHRMTIVGFPAHGSRKKIIDIKLSTA
jgi:hypothetical protein